MPRSNFSAAKIFAVLPTTSAAHATRETNERNECEFMGSWGKNSAGKTKPRSLHRTPRERASGAAPDSHARRSLMRLSQTRPAVLLTLHNPFCPHDRKLPPSRFSETCCAAPARGGRRFHAWRRIGGLRRCRADQARGRIAAQGVMQRLLVRQAA